MMKRTIETMADVEAVLREYYLSSGLPTIGTNYRLQDTFDIAARVGNPHESLRVIHVAGTSGKTSTTYYVAALLRQTGKRVGWTVSPHVSSLLERVQIDTGLLDEKLFASYFSEFLPLATDNYTVKPSFFELIAVFGLWVLAREQVEYAVIETGMGGMYDSTNICRRKDKLCIITDIGLDHTHILGNTLYEIAEQKAGIIADDNVVCMYEQSLEVMDATRAAVDTHNALLILASPVDGQTYFDRNFHLAETAYAQLAQRDNLPAVSYGRRNIARHTTIPGRLEAIEFEGTKFILDGAHNEQKMRAMLTTLDSVYGKHRWPIILALKHDKDISAVTDLIIEHAKYLIATEYLKSQDMPVTPKPAAEIAEVVGASVEVSVIPRIADALQSIQLVDEAHVLVTGSFYAVSEARAWLLARGGTLAPIVLP